VMGAGCASERVPRGASGVESTYKLTTMSALAPDTARVPAVIAAAEAVVRARGYTVVRSESTEEAGRLIARPPRYKDYPRVVLEARRMGGGTRVTVQVEPFGDRELSGSILDATLRRLGL